MTNLNDMVFKGGERHSVFGRDPDGKKVCNEVELAAEDAMSIALENLLPGDELITIEGNCIVVAQVKEATPMGVTSNGHLSWAKHIVITEKVQVTEKTYLQEVQRFMPAGVHAKVVRLYDGDVLVELTYGDGHKALLVGILKVDTEENSKQGNEIE